MKNAYHSAGFALMLTMLASTGLHVRGEELQCGDWTLDCRPVNGSTTDVIITKATGSGALDLTQAQGRNITGALPSSFAYNPDLTSVILPASMTTLSAYLSEQRDITGEGEPYTESSPSVSDKSVGIINLDYNLNNQPVRIRLNVTSDGSAANQYGCCLLASGTDPFNQGSYAGGFQIFLEKGSEGVHTVTVKDGTSTSGTKFAHDAGKSFQIELYYNPHYNFLMTAVRYEDGTVDSVTASPSDFSVTTLCYGLPLGVDETMSVSDACMPFAGCSGLQSITVADGSAAFSNGPDGILLDASGTTMAAYPYGRLFGPVVRIESVSAPERCFSVDAYASGGGYEARSVDFQSPDTYFGTTLFRLEANDDGTCSFRHLNTGFLLGRKSDNTSMTLDAVQDPVYSGRYDYTLVPGSPATDGDSSAAARFVFTDPYVGPTQNFDGVWCVTNVDGAAMMQKNPSVAGAESNFHVVSVDEVAIPVNSHDLASVSLPVDFTVPDTPISVYKIMGFDSYLDALSTVALPAGSVVKAGSGVLLKNWGAGDINVKISSVEKSEGASLVTSEAEETDMTGNILAATNLRVPSAEGVNYLLYDNGYQAQSAADISANSAYLKESSLSADATSKDFLDLVSEVYTGVENVEDELTDIDDLPAFDLQGRPVDIHHEGGVIIAGRRKMILRR